MVKKLLQSRGFKWAITLGLLAALMPILLFAGYGITKGYFVGSGLFNLIWDPTTTVDTNPDFTQLPARVSWVTDIHDYNIAESSGLAASQLHEGLLWTINDSGSEPYLYGVDLNGQTQATVYVSGGTNDDWESLDSFELDGVSYLAIADTGDNFRWRPTVRILVVPEPTSLTQRQVELAWQLEFRYPDGPKDSEAMAIDAQIGRIMVLSKREYPPRLFELPLKPERDEVLTAAPLWSLPLPRPTHLDLELDDTAKYRHMPSGMDLVRRGDGEALLLITTYQHAYQQRLIMDSTITPAEALNQVLLPSLGQREAIAFADGKTDVAYLTKERRQQTGFADIFEINMSGSGPLE